MGWLLKRQVLALLIAITIGFVLLRGKYHSLLSSRFWNPSDAQSGFRVHVDGYFYALLGIWLLYGIGRGAAIRRRGKG